MCICGEEKLSIDKNRLRSWSLRERQSIRENPTAMQGL